MAADLCSKDQLQKVVKNALAAARASQAGETTVAIGDGVTAQRFALREGGYCARFVRQVFETACALKGHTWRFGAASALEMCEAMRAVGRKVGIISVSDLMPGDVVGINRNSGQYGHIAIYVGLVESVPTIAENTSSATRGNPRRPGTKLTPYADIAARVTGVYRLRAALQADWPEFRAFVLMGGKYQEVELVPGGDHRADQGKTYWRLRQ
jgi:hypothetical protein